MSLNELESFSQKQLISYLIRKKRAEFETCPPYKVDLVDMFEGYCEDGYGNIGSYESLEEAIRVARKYTEDSLALDNGKIDDWLDFGDAGLVYDTKGNLIWDGSIEYGKAEQLKTLLESEAAEQEQAKPRHEWLNKLNKDSSFVVAKIPLKEGDPITESRPFTKAEQEELLINPAALHDLATYCWADHSVMRVSHPPQGYDASRRILSSKDIFIYLRKRLPDAEDDLILFAGRRMREIIKNIVKAGSIMPPGVYH